jgi:hypothetical protein
LNQYPRGDPEGPMVTTYVCIYLAACDPQELPQTAVHTPGCPQNDYQTYKQKWCLYAHRTEKKNQKRKMYIHCGKKRNQTRPRAGTVVPRPEGRDTCSGTTGPARTSDQHWERPTAGVWDSGWEGP